MEIERAAVNISRLEQAFRHLTGVVPGLEVEVLGHVAGNEGVVHPVAGFQVRLEREDGAAGVTLFVSTSYAELVRWFAGDDGDGGALREPFNVRLGEEFLWGETAFPTAEALADALLAYMQFNVDVAPDRAAGAA